MLSAVKKSSFCFLLLTLFIVDAQRIPERFYTSKDIGNTISYV